MKIFVSLLCVVAFSTTINAQDEKREVMAVAQQFFDALEKGDTVSFRGLFVEDGRNYFIQDKDSKAQSGSRSPKSFHYNKDRIVRERFIPGAVEVLIQGRIAVVWGKYNLWINDKFSHCGVDAFTMLKTDQGWKISALSYSMEYEGCDVK